jgi:hypothetical protein
MLIIKYIVKYNIKVVVFLSILMLFSISNFNCTTTLKSQKTDLKLVKLKFNLPIVSLNGELHNINDSLFIYFSDSVILYKVLETHPLEEQVGIIKSEPNYSYFLYKEKAKYGYKFKSLNDSGFLKLSVDSFLLEKAFNAFEGYKFYNKTNDSMVNSFENINGVVMHTYVPKKMYDDSYSDTTFLYFTHNLKNSKYTFSKYLDDSMKLKLFKIRLLYKKKYSDTYKITLPQRELLFEMKEDSVINKAEITRFIQNGIKKYL